MSRIEAFKQYQSDFYRSSGKEVCEGLGVEFEHFLIDRTTMESCSYDEPGGQHELLKKLANRGWRVILEEDGWLLGVEKGGDTVTLEPGGQVEISLGVQKTVCGVDRAYQRVFGEITALLSGNQALASIGYHPKTRIAQLPLLPKSRYRMMYDYFTGRGSLGRNMMKGSAATQVSIDYRDEADFIKKFRVANFLSPFIARIFDAAPVFEGKIYDGENCRILIWQNTDTERSKLIAGSLDRIFKFEDYADFLLRTPPIVASVNGGLVYTRGERLAGLLERLDFKRGDYGHFASMVFPDVRLKSFIEIRMADALPYPYNMAVPALIRGIFYDQKNLDKYYRLSRQFRDEDINTLNSRLTKAIDFRYKGLETTAFSLEIVEDAMSALDGGEAAYLGRMKSVILKDGSMARRLKALYADQPEEFAALITRAPCPKPSPVMCNRAAV